MGRGTSPGTGQARDDGPPSDGYVGPGRIIRVVLTGLVVIFTLASGLGVVLLWPDGDVPTPIEAQGAFDGLTPRTAEVLGADVRVPGNLRGPATGRNHPDRDPVRHRSCDIDLRAGRGS